MDTTTLHLSTKLKQPFWSRNPEASSQEAIAVTTTTTILLEEEQAQQAEAEAEVVEAQHRQHHLNQKPTMMTCRKSSRSTATTAPFPNFNFSGSTPPRQRRRVSSSRRIRAKHSRDHTARNGAKRWIRKSRHFSPAIPGRNTSVRILLAIAAAQHVPLYQIDMKNAFLYAIVDAVIYVDQLHTYAEGDSRVCQLRKSLYVIKQAPRLWQQYLHNILLEIGFKKLPHNPGMYRRDFRGEYILLTVFVDDLLYT
ncbi:unnamed protein product [Closterium sp. NIES-54]